MRSLLWILLFLFGLTGVVVPVLYLYGAGKLPQLESQLDLERLLRQQVEGERMSVQLGLQPKFRKIDWSPQSLDHYPRELVALTLSSSFCPNFFNAPREDGLAWALRVLTHTWGGNTTDNPNAACELYFTQRLVDTLKIEGTLARAVAIHKVHGFLNKEQLIAFDLSTAWVGRGVAGADQAAEVMMQKPLSEMSLAELAEFSMVMPPWFLWESLWTCQNGPALQEDRDRILRQLGADLLATPEQVNAAMATPIRCTHIHH